MPTEKHDPVMIGEGEFIAEVGVCTKHNSLAKRYDDGSFCCWWEDVVEASGNHDERDFMPLREWEASRAE